MNKVNKEELNKFCKAPVLMTESNWFTGNELNNISFLSGLAMQGLLSNPNNSNKEPIEIASKAYECALELAKKIVINK